MKRFINPFTDMAFKRLFGQDKHKNILMGFLNTLFEGELKIEDITYEDKEQVGEDDDSRTIIFDILCTTKEGEHIIVEMQNRSQPNFKERSIYYMSSAIINQGHKGNWDYDIKAVYGVFFMNFISTAIKPRLRNDVVFAYKDSGEQFSDKMRMVYITIPLMTKKEDECVNNFERWIYVMKNMEHLTEIPYKDIIAEMLNFEEVADYESLKGDARRKYERDLKRYRDNLSCIQGAREEGIAEGIAEGREEGLKEGRKEEKRQIALALKKSNVSINIITDCTGLTPDEIARLN
jgi:predicted transposase/invertase (TIGR01784 family)